MTNSLELISKASQMLVEATTIQKAKELKNLSLTAAINEAGVYLISYKNYWLYIGESQNIRKRLNSHELSGWFKLPDVKINWFADKNRKHTEKKLIVLLDPLLNGEGHSKHYAALSEAQGKPCDWSSLYFSKESSVRRKKRKKLMKEYYLEMINAIS